MSKCPCIILTRFNLLLNFGAKKRHNSSVPEDKPHLNDKYLEERFAIFEKYTFRSLVNQTDKDFRWIVLFHKDTPSCFKERIYSYAQTLIQFEPWFLDDNECLKFGEIVKEYLKKEYPLSSIITTRVDNDDAVHERFVEIIRKEFEGCNKPSVLTFTNGLQYDSLGKRLLKYQYINNHFLSLYVPNTKSDNHILLYNHYTIDSIINEKVVKLVCVSEIPCWVEVITNSNFSNEVRWRFSTVIVPYRMKEEFPFIELAWNSKMEWLISCLTGELLVFVNRSKGLLMKVCRRGIR